MRRTQIYLDAEQDRALSRRAVAEGSTKSHLIREAIDAYLAAPTEAEDRIGRFRAALDLVVAKPARLPSGTAYVARVREGEARREADIERRRR